MKGATRSGSMRIFLASSFNPRTREGCDRALLGDDMGLGSFNPRTREGCDLGVDAPAATGPMFQSTHP